MESYLIMKNPGHNRAYFTNAASLALAEAELCAQRLDAWSEERPINVSETDIAGLPYIELLCNDALTDRDLAALGTLSCFYALFHREGELLRPVRGKFAPYVDPKMSSLLKYQGKTNELFTRLLINAAAFSIEGGSRARLLDPVSGKGTTLYEAAVLGMDAYGVEIGTRTVNEAYHFVKRFLEEERLKHTQAQERVSGANRSFTAERYHFEITRTKEEEKAGERHIIELVAGESSRADSLYKKGFFDIVAGDLPYGVQHASVTNEKQSETTRDVAKLVKLCLPAWTRVLRRGGALALAWNINTLPRAELAKLIAGAGYEVMERGAYLNMAHRVDAAIVRDIIVAVKK